MKESAFWPSPTRSMIKTISAKRRLQLAGDSKARAAVAFAGRLVKFEEAEIAKRVPGCAHVWRQIAASEQNAIAIEHAIAMAREQPAQRAALSLGHLCLGEKRPGRERPGKVGGHRRKSESHAHNRPRQDLGTAG